MKCMLMLIFFLVAVSMMGMIDAHNHWKSGECHCQYGGERGGHCHCPSHVRNADYCRWGYNHWVCFPFGRRKRDLLEQAGRLSKKE